MKSIESYIDDLKEKTGSDYKTAQIMGVEKSVISAIRRRGAISDDNAVKVAELLGIDPGEILLAAAMARSHGAVREAWENVSKRAGIAATIIIAMATTSLFTTELEAISKAEHVYYVMCRNAPYFLFGFADMLY